MPTNLKSQALVGIQLACIVYLLATLTLATFTLPDILLAGGAIILGLWALITLGPSRVRVLPEPSQNACLATSGPYRVVRHPMYTAAIVLTVALVLDKPSWDRLGAAVILLVDLILKLRYEEYLLSRRFPEYADYRRRTWRLFPPIY